MDLLVNAWQLIVHLDQVLGVWLRDYGSWVYGILFAIVFCETGLVIAPFLPGDSLLFAAGALWASADRSVLALCLTLIGAAFCGDNCNYWIGRRFGRRIERAHGRWINREGLARTQVFYRSHGGRMVVLARFVPIVRTFSPFVAGLSSMPYGRFIAFSVGGAILWVGLLVSAGYWFGNIPFVRQNFSIAILAVIVISILPLAVEWLRSRSKAAGAR